MTTVESLESTARRRGRGVRVMVAGKTAVTLPEAAVVELGIRPGIAWTPALARQAEHLRQVYAACAAAQRLLKARDRSRAEIRERLAMRGIATPVIDDAVERLSRAGLIDDARSAQASARSQTARVPAARAMVAQTLESRGYDPRLASRAAADAAGGRSDRELAEGLAAEAIAAAPRGLARDALIRRVRGKLARRGFDEDLARDAVESRLGPLE